MRKNAEKMDLSSRNRLLRVPAGSHGFWAHDPLPDPSHDPDVDPRRVTIPLAFTSFTRTVAVVVCSILCRRFVSICRIWAHDIPTPQDR